eukprot:7249278-Prymnesium_polylepis.1
MPLIVPSFASFLKQRGPIGDSPNSAPSHSSTATFPPSIRLTESTTNAVTPGASWSSTGSRMRRGSSLISRPWARCAPTANRRRRPAS